MKFFKVIFDIIKSLAFWGMFGLIILLTLFKVNFNTIFNVAQSGNGNIQYFTAFLIISVPTFIALGIISLVIDKIITRDYPENFKMIVSFNIEIILMMPISGFIPKGIINSIRDGYFFEGEWFAYVLGLVKTALWWGLCVWAYVSINGSDNGISLETAAIPHEQKLYLIAITVVIIVCLNIISKIVSKIIFVIWKRQTDEPISSYTETEPYRGYVPVGCRACGGPYPDCRTSCNMFDN